MQIPAAELRTFVDGMFPTLATNGIADSVSGFGHRYRAGHDLLLDVPRTMFASGPAEGLKHAGHILLTDLPTRAGIPIPGFSHSGLGHLLEHAGISSGWLQLNVFDWGLGLSALADGTSSLTLALSGALQMKFATACQTFGAGAIELMLAAGTQNPLLAAGGIQHVMAGLVSTWDTFSVYVSPLDFFGAAAMSTLLGLGLSYCLVGASLSEAIRAAARSGVIGALYSVSTGFGFAALAGLAACRLGGMLAEKHNQETRDRLAIDGHTYRMLRDVLLVDSSTTRLTCAALSGAALDPTPQAISAQPPLLDIDWNELKSEAMVLESACETQIAASASVLDQKALSLPSDPDELEGHYRAALALMRGPLY
jgi:hypothetical protein